MARSSQFPPVTKFTLISITAFSLLTFVLRYSAYIHIVAAETHNEDHSHLIPDADGPDPTQIPSPQDIYVPIIVLAVNSTGFCTHIFKKPWTFVTTTMIENSIAAYLITSILFAYMGRYIETLWGSRELLRYLLLNVIGSNLVCFTYFSIKHWGIVSNGDITITGGVSLLMALIIGIKQRIPNQYFLFFNGSIKIGVSLVPFWILVFITVLSVFLPHLKVISVLTWSAFWISWTYLRFWKEGGSGRQLSLLPSLQRVSSILEVNFKGDRTSQFALHTFFPYPLSIFVKLVSEKIFSILIKANLVSNIGFTSDPEEEVDNNSILHQDLFSMSDSKIFTSCSLSRVSSTITMFKLPSFLIFFKNDEDIESQKSLDHRRQIALKELTKD